MKKEEDEKSSKKKKAATKVKEEKVSKRKKKEEEEVEVFRWWDDNEKEDDSIKWTTLEHQGPYFPPEYVSHGIKMKYKGIINKIYFRIICVYIYSIIIKYYITFDSCEE